MDFVELNSMSVTALRSVARESDVEGYSSLRKNDLVFEILRVEARRK